MLRQSEKEHQVLAPCLQRTRHLHPYSRNELWSLRWSSRMESRWSSLDNGSGCSFLCPGDSSPWLPCLGSVDLYRIQVLEVLPNPPDEEHSQVPCLRSHYHLPSYYSRGSHWVQCVYFRSNSWLRKHRMLPLHLGWIRNLLLVQAKKKCWSRFLVKRRKDRHSNFWEKDQGRWDADSARWFGAWCELIYQLSPRWQGHVRKELRERCS